MMNETSFAELKKFKNQYNVDYSIGDLTPDDQMKVGCFQMLAFLIILLALLSLCILLR